MTSVNKLTFFNLNTPKISFRQNFAGNNAFGIHSGGITGDTFSLNPLYQKLSAKDIESIVRSNPRIMNILKENKIPLKFNIQEFENLQNGHLKDTRVVAAKIYSALPENLKKEVNMSNLQQAAMYHDYGKILIPSKILNKNGKLTDEERKIMELHSELGYEMLKSMGANDEVLYLVKHHHQNPLGTGYPKVDSNFEYTTSLDILRAADEYSALRETRSYKDSMPKDAAYKILAGNVENGQIKQESLDALVKTT